MKLLAASIYTNYTSHIVDDEGIEPTDGYTSHPISGQLWLRFDRIEAREEAAGRRTLH